MPTDEDDTFFERCQEALYALYAGKWVLIHHGVLVGVYDRMDSVFAAAGPLGSCLVRHLGPDDTFRVPQITDPDCG